MLDAHDFVTEYLAAATDPDRERYVALFADSVVVHDDGQTHRGREAVRRWRAEVPPVRYSLREVTGGPAEVEAVVDVSGDFPGSPVALRFAFRRDAQGRIVALDIAP